MSLLRHFEFKTVGAWYQGANFKDSHLVTSENQNVNLGIESIILLEPNTKADNNILANVAVTTTAVDFNGTIFLSKDGESLVFNVESREYKVGSETKWTPVFNVKQAVSAQILRHAESRRLETPIAWAEPATTTQPFDMSALTPEQLAMIAQAAGMTAAATQQVQSTTQPAATLPGQEQAGLPAQFGALPK